MYSSQGIDINKQTAAGKLQSENELNKLKDSAQEIKKSNKQGLKEACNKFETLFVKKMWKRMQDTLPEDGMFNSKIQKKYMSMFDQKFAQKMTEQGGIGLSQFLYDQLQTSLETAGNSTFPGSSSTEKNKSSVSEGKDLQSAVKTEYLAKSNSALQTKNTTSAQKAGESNNTSNTEGKTADKKVEDLAREIISQNGAVNKDEEVEKDPLPARDKKVSPSKQASYSSSGPFGLPQIKMPVDSEISSDFGWRKDPITGERAWHAGVDFAADSGESVKACWPGEVSFVGEKDDYGKTVIVEHPGGWKSIYAHNSENKVKEGDRVNQGEAIAQVGDTGRSTGSHLHFELRQGTQAWDPKQIEQRLLAGLNIGKNV